MFVSNKCIHPGWMRSDVRGARDERQIVTINLVARHPLNFEAVGCVLLRGSRSVDVGGDELFLKNSNLNCSMSDVEQCEDMRQ